MYHHNNIVSSLLPSIPCAFFPCHYASHKFRPVFAPMIFWLECPTYHDRLSPWDGLPDRIVKESIISVYSYLSTRFLKIYFKDLLCLTRFFFFCSSVLATYHVYLFRRLQFQYPLEKSNYGISMMVMREPMCFHDKVTFVFHIACQSDTLCVTLRPETFRNHFPYADRFYRFM